MNENGKFEMHCVVELFGHSRIAGKVSEQAIGGGGFIRVDVPKTTRREGFTKFYGPSAIYAMTPVSDQIAQIMAERLEVEPVSEWQLSQALQNLLPAEVVPTVAEKPWSDDFDDEPVPEEPETSETDKLAAAQWARDLLKTEFIIFDTETTGFDADDEIIQIGVIDQAGDVVLEQLIKPEQTIANAQYHGITDETVKDAPKFPVAYEQIKTALTGQTVIAYNFAYDRKMLNQVCQKHKLEIIEFNGQACAMEMYAQFNGAWNDYHGNYRWVKLREALADFDLKHEDFGEKEHDACTDARATLAVIKKMAEYETVPS